MKKIKSVFVILAILKLCIFIYSSEFPHEGQQPTNINEELISQIKLNNIDGVRNAITNGASLNYQDDTGFTPLLYACGTDRNNNPISIAIAKLLISKGADINKRSQDGKLPILYALSSGRTELVDYLLSLDLKVNYIEKFLIHCGTGNITQVKIILKKHESNLNGFLLSARDAEGRSALHYAANCGKLAIVEVLTQSGANVNAITKKRLTPLMLASLYGHLNIVKFLVQKGANVNAQDIKGFTPLMVASILGHIDTIRFLIQKGANVNASPTDGSGFTALKIAKIKGYIDIVKLLAQAGARE